MGTNPPLTPSDLPISDRPSVSGQLQSFKGPVPGSKEEDLPPSCTCGYLRQNIESLLSHILNNVTNSGPSRTVYSKDRVYEVLTKKNIKKILLCDCHQCPSIERAMTDNDMFDRIYTSYRLVLANLLILRHTHLISLFVRRGHTDKSVLACPLAQEIIEELAKEGMMKIGIVAEHHSPGEFYRTQFEYLMPQQNYYLEKHQDAIDRDWELSN